MSVFILIAEEEKQIIKTIKLRCELLHFPSLSKDEIKQGIIKNYGLDEAKGDYIIFFDDDDIAHPQNLEICVHELSTKDISTTALGMDLSPRFFLGTSPQRIIRRLLVPATVRHSP